MIGILKQLDLLQVLPMRKPHKDNLEKHPHDEGKHPRLDPITKKFRKEKIGIKTESMTSVIQTIQDGQANHYSTMLY